MVQFLLINLLAKIIIPMIISFFKTNIEKIQKVQAPKREKDLFVYNYHNKNLLKTKVEIRLSQERCVFVVCQLKITYGTKLIRKQA